MYIGGLDIGTTGCKVSVYDDKGNFVCNSYREYKVSRKDGEHEFDAEMIYDAVLEVIGEASKQCEISAVGVTSFGESFVALVPDLPILYIVFKSVSPTLAIVTNDMLTYPCPFMKICRRDDPVRLYFDRILYRNSEAVIRLASALHKLGDKNIGKGKII